MSVLPGMSLSGSLTFADGMVNGRYAKTLRDSGCTFIAVRETLLKPNDYIVERVRCRTITGEITELPMAEIFIDTPYFKGRTKACVLPSSTVADLIIGNVPGLGTCNEEECSVHKIHYGCALTRAMSKKKKSATALSNCLISLHVTPEEFKTAQTSDETLKSCFDKVRTIQTDKIYFEIENDVLVRVHRSERKLSKRLVVPKKYRNDVLAIAHDIPMAGHQGIRRTKTRITSEFYWPGMYKAINEYVKSCDICQKTAQKNQCPKAPLGKMPNMGIPFYRVSIDLVGPLSKSDRNCRYILTVVDVATRWLEAVPLKETTTEHVAEALVSIFTRVGIPVEILSDNGPQFVSTLMTEVIKLMGIKHVFCTPYHPQANGLCERMNGSIKQMLRKVTDGHPQDWDRLLPSVLFSYRELPQDGTGFSPFELVYGRTPRGPMALLRQLYTNKSLDEEVKTTYQYTIDLERRIHDSCQLAKSTLQQNADINASYADRTAKLRVLEPGDKTLVLLPLTKNKLLMKWQGPYEVLKRCSKVNYSVNIKGVVKIFHINMLKKYTERSGDKDESIFEAVGASMIQDEDDGVEILCPETEPIDLSRVHINNNLSTSQKEDVNKLLEEFSTVISDKPGFTSMIEHEIVLSDDIPIFVKQYPLPFKSEEIVISETKAMLDMSIIEPSNSAYSFPVVLVKKKDGTTRFCVDYRKLNAITVLDRENIPNQDDLFIKLWDAQFFTKIDLCKGYWQIPMEENSKRYTAFQTPLGLMQFRFMPFGLVNAPATFARMMRSLLREVPCTISYFDDVLSFNQSWDEHLITIRSVLSTLEHSGLTAKASKMFIAFNEIGFLGHMVSDGCIRPEEQKTLQILELTAPKTKKQVQSLLGLMGYYRKFVPNFADLTAPLTALVKKGCPTNVTWTDECQKSLEKVKEVFSNKPILILPDFNETFIVRTDASDVGVGAMLLQDRDGILMPCAFASRKLLERETRYPIIERECLAIVFALNRFSRYLRMSQFIIETDHKPLSYLTKKKTSNGRLFRWALALQEYSFNVRAIPGRENVHADALSRLT